MTLSIIRNIVTFSQVNEPLTAVTGDVWIFPGTATKKQCIGIGPAPDSLPIWEDMITGAITDNNRYPGELWGWGRNNVGQLGMTSVNTSSPVQIGTLTNWLKISSGQYQCLAIKTDGTLWSWGDNQVGVLGDGTTTNKSSPGQVGNLTTWKEVSVHIYHAMAIKTDGTLWGWGTNENTQLGIPGGSVSSPVQVGTLTTWKQVKTGLHNTAAIKIDGTLWAWGQNNYGQLGINSTTEITSPVQVGSLTTWSAVGGGQYHTLAIKTDGTLWSWGDNALGAGQLGDNTVIQKSSPIQVGTLTTWCKLLNSLQYESAAIKTDGTLWTWGDGSYGQIGDGTITDKSSPSQVGSGTTWKNIDCGVYHQVAIKTDGTLWSWACNNDGAGYGMLGDNTIINKSSPIQVGMLTNWKAVEAGIYHSIAIRTHDTSDPSGLYGWGLNDLGQIGQ